MKREPAAKAFSLYETAVGFGVLAASETGLVANLLPYGAGSAAAAQELVAAQYPAAQGESGVTATAAGLLTRYFAGEQVVFDLPLDLDGSTDFTLQVYRQVAGIPYGSVMSYAEVAAACGSPKAARAIGAAMAGNSLPIVIPCHRVVAKNGLMTGFTAPGGIASKRQLLVMEGVVLNDRGAVKG